MSSGDVYLYLGCLILRMVSDASRSQHYSPYLQSRLYATKTIPTPLKILLILVLR